MRLAELIIDVVLNSSGARNALGALDQRLARTAQRANVLSQRFLAIGQSLNSLRTGVAATGVIGGFTNVAGTFEQVMIRAADATRATAEQTEELNAKTKTFAASGALNAARAIEVLGKNGLSATQVLDGALVASVNLAGALKADVAQAADLATDAMLQFSLQAEELPRVADLITGTAFASKLGFEDLRLAVAQGGGVAGGSNLELTDFLAGIAAASPFTAGGSDAGTGFKTFLTSLVPSTKAAREAIDELGLSFTNADGSLKDMTAIAGELERVLPRLSDEQRTLAQKTIFGNDAMRIAIGFSKAGADGIRKLREEIESVSAAQKAELALRGVNGALGRLGRSIQKFLIVAGETGLLGAVENIANALADAIDNLALMNPEIIRAVAIIGALTVSLGPLTIALALAFRMFGLMSLQASIFAFRMLASFGAVILVVEDLFSYFDGRDSLIGRAVEWLSTFGVESETAAGGTLALAGAFVVFGKAIAALLFRVLLLTPLGWLALLIQGFYIFRDEIYGLFDAIGEYIETKITEALSAIEERLVAIQDIWVSWMKAIGLIDENYDPAESSGGSYAPVGTSSGGGFIPDRTSDPLVVVPVPPPVSIGSGEGISRAFSIGEANIFVSGNEGGAEAGRQIIREMEEYLSQGRY